MRFCPTCGARYSTGADFCTVDGQRLETLADEETALRGSTLVGRTLDGRYRVEKVLGEGGMGVVYLVTHVALGKRMALKVLHGEGARDETTVARFVQEAQASSAIGHPNIVDVIDFGRLADGSAYFVMELLEGESLTDRIKRGAIPLEQTIAIAEQIASALAAAHARGIVHRDLKPDNVQLVRRNAEEAVKVLDFGIAKVGGASSKLTKTGMIFGTPHYMSPEQAAGQSVDARTDVYALGVILFEMATGTVPFDGDTFMGILSKHMFEPPPRPTNVLGSTHPLEPVILRALAKKPEDRYASMDALLADLRIVREGGEVADTSGPIRPPSGFGAPPPAIEPPTTSWRAPMVFLGVLGALLVTGIGVGLYLALRAQRAPVVTSLTEPVHASTAAVTPIAVDAIDAVQGVGSDDSPGAGGTATDSTVAPPTVDPEPAGNDVGAGTTVDVIRIDSVPPRAVVLVEGAIVGTTPLDVPRPREGELAIELRARGHVSRSLTLSAATGEEIVASLERVRRTNRESDEPEPVEPAPSVMPRMRPGVPSEVVDPWAE
ncbi:MAG: protein kinase [Myxococcota bacterium]|jgi:serine/threonine-protein kinase|nr:protein kinase [Myxococcota bacterium]